jgi:hypothetical protein
MWHPTDKKNVRGLIIAAAIGVVLGFGLAAYGFLRAEPPFGVLISPTFLLAFVGTQAACETALFYFLFRFFLDRHLENRARPGRRGILAPALIVVACLAMQAMNVVVAVGIPNSVLYSGSAGEQSPQLKAATDACFVERDLKNAECFQKFGPIRDEDMKRRSPAWRKVMECDAESAAQYRACVAKVKTAQ